jgi:hypothetical protein
MATTAAGRARQRAAYERAERRLAELEAGHGRKQRRRAKIKRRSAERVVVCPSEPAAALGKDKEKVFRPLYNVQLACDLDSPLVLGYGVYAAAGDAGLLGPALERVRRLAGRLPAVVAADGSYASALDLAWCARQQVTLYAPCAAEAAAGDAGRQLPKAAFRWLAAEQAYLCPEGQRLPLTRRTKEGRQDGQELVVLQFRCPPEHCCACPRQPACTSAPQRGRTIKRHEHEELVEQLRERMATAAGRALYRLRKQVVERGFADLKAHRGLRRFRSYGPERAQAQVGLVVLAHNGLAWLRARQRAAQAATTPLAKTG